MIFNHPSAYLYTSPCSLQSGPSRRNSMHMQWTPAPHVGASEGPTWSPYLKSPLPVASPSSVSSQLSPDACNWIDGTSANSYSQSQAMDIPRLLTGLPATRFEDPEQSPPLSARSSASSSISSYFSVPGDASDDGDEAERVLVEGRAVYEMRLSLEAMVQEPSSPMPSYAKAIASRTMEA